jgi:hypothetical protein
VLNNYPTAPDYSFRYKFRLKNIKVTDFGGDTIEEIEETTLSGSDIDVIEYTQDYGLTSTIGAQGEIEGLVYLGKEIDIDANTANTPENLGFRFEKTNKFAFYKLKPSNIYTQLLLETDLQNFQTEFPNQIVWSESYVRGSNASGTRNFTFTNFLNIERTYGAIVQLAYVLDKLLVFCERGVAVVSVGEVLTQQVGGNVVVNSATLLNGYFFYLRNLVDVKAKSVVKYENVLFFGDGDDVWQYDGQFKNISNGAISLAKNAMWVGAIDPANKEYVLTDGTDTYAFAIDLNEWQGKYSFTGKAYTTYQDRMYGELGNRLVEHNVGNTMNGTAYTTIIESVANDLNAPHDVKMFRKFYIEATDPITLKYGKEYGTWQTKLFTALASKNGQYHAGIAPSEHNSTKLFWTDERRSRTS